MTRLMMLAAGLIMGIATVFCCVDTAHAKKPDNPGGGGDNNAGNGGGVIYFSYEGRPYTMNDDGSSVTVLENFPASYYANFNEEPSRDLHAGKRWFLDGDGLVILSDAGDIVPLDLASDISHSNPRWGVGDGFLSWVGQRWDDDATSPNYSNVVEGGLYTIDVDFDQQGNIQGTVGSPQLLVSFPLVDCPAGTPCADVVAPDIQSHDWSPDGTQFVYDTLVDRELRIYDLDTNSEATILSEGESWSPQWSPAGDQIMFSHYAGRRRSGIWAVGVDGSDMTQIQADNNNQHPKVGAWSPTGSHLIYLSDDVSNLDSHIVRATSGGKSKTLLTDERFETGFNALWPLGWRETQGSAATVVPEPSAQLLVLIGLVGCITLSRSRLVTIRLTAVAVPFFACLPIHAFADTFGSGANQFEIEFVAIGNPGNDDDTMRQTNPDGPLGKVEYAYRMGKLEISEVMIDKANAQSALDGNPLGITKDTRGPDKPATNVTWFEAAMFVNWLNNQKGAFPAYKFNGSTFELWEPGDAGYDPNNRFRNSQAFYFLPSVDEWYKAAYYDGTAEIYFDYPTGSDSVPDGIDFAGDPTFDAVFFDGGLNPQPNDITDAGVLSPYGTAGQGGNVFEWMETEFDLVNDCSSSDRAHRGGGWDGGSGFLWSLFGNLNREPTFEDVALGFRVASIPEPSSLVLTALGLFGLLGRARLSRQ